MIHLGDVEALAYERGAAMRQWAEHERLLRLARQHRAATASARRTIQPGRQHEPYAAWRLQHDRRAWRDPRLSGHGVLLRVLLALVAPLRAIRVN